MTLDGFSHVTDLAARLDGLQEAMASLEKQISRAGREQLKANTLAEAQAERLGAAIDELRAAGERREAELAAERARARTAAAEARLDVARAMFPSLDGLDEALRAGHMMLDQDTWVEPPADLLRRILFNLPAPERREVAAMRSALRAWLNGLEMVRRRMLDALAAEGVSAIEAEGRPFDPRLHLAVEAVVAPVPPGTVLQVIRRGFVAGDRVLRHAEVRVAR